MPLIHISLRAGKPEAYRQAIFDSLYGAMREALSVPEDDQFMTISEHDAANFRYGNAYGVVRSADVVYIQITVFDSRTVEQKTALFRRTAELLGESPGIRAEDVFVNIGERELVRRPRPRAICLRTTLRASAHATPTVVDITLSAAVF
jgi:4-oxalocrotonate tautomerase